MSRLSILKGISLLILGMPVAGFSQSTVLQGGPLTIGHFPMYIGQSSFQPVIGDSGSAAGGGVGVGASELLLTLRGNGSPPYANGGTGALGSNFCDYDAPITNSTGYHYLCLSPNAQGGGLLAVGQGGTASLLGWNLIVNGNTAITVDPTGVVSFPSGGTIPPVIANVSNITAGSSVTLSAATDIACVNKIVAGTITIVLPAAPLTGKAYTIKDCKGDSFINNITVSPTAGTVDGQSTALINTPYGALNVFYNGSNWFTR